MKRFTVCRLGLWLKDEQLKEAGEAGIVDLQR